MKHLAKLIIVLGFLFYGSVHFVSADVALSVPYLKSNLFEMDDEPTVFQFILKNSGGTQETAKVRFRVPEKSGVLLNDVVMFEQTYVVSPHSQKVVEVEITPNGEMIFSLIYGFSETESNSGDLRFDVWVEGSFDVEVDDCNRDCRSYLFALNRSYKYIVLDFDDVFSSYVVKGLVIESSSGFGSIDFLNKEINLEGFKDDYVKIENNKVYVDSNSFDVLDEDSIITMRKLSYDNTPEILKNGRTCNDCNIKSYNNGILVFEANGFSEYTTVADNDNLNIKVNSETDKSSSSGYMETVGEDMSILSSDTSSVTEKVVDVNQDSVFDDFKSRVSLDKAKLVSDEPVKSGLLAMAISFLIAVGLFVFIFKSYDKEELKSYLKGDKQ